jgi:hypothetical protein
MYRLPPIHKMGPAGRCNWIRGKGIGPNSQNRCRQYTQNAYNAEIMDSRQEWVIVVFIGRVRNCEPLTGAIFIRTKHSQGQAPGLGYMPPLGAIPPILWKILKACCVLMDNSLYLSP